MNPIAIAAAAAKYSQTKQSQKSSKVADKIKTPGGLEWKYVTDIAKSELEPYRRQHQVHFNRYSVQNRSTKFVCTRNPTALSNCQYKMLAVETDGKTLNIYENSAHNHEVVPIKSKPNPISVVASPHDSLTQYIQKLASNATKDHDLQQAADAQQCSSSNSSAMLSSKSSEKLSKQSSAHKIVGKTGQQRQQTRRLLRPNRTTTMPTPKTPPPSPPQTSNGPLLGPIVNKTAAQRIISKCGQYGQPLKLAGLTYDFGRLDQLRRQECLVVDKQFDVVNGVPAKVVYRCRVEPSCPFEWHAICTRETGEFELYAPDGNAHVHSSSIAPQPPNPTATAPSPMARSSAGNSTTAPPISNDPIYAISSLFSTFTNSPLTVSPHSSIPIKRSRPSENSMPKEFAAAPSIDGPFTFAGENESNFVNGGIDERPQNVDYNGDGEIIAHINDLISANNSAGTAPPPPPKRQRNQRALVNVNLADWTFVGLVESCEIWEHFRSQRRVLPLQQPFNTVRQATLKCNRRGRRRGHCPYRVLLFREETGGPVRLYERGEHNHGSVETSTTLGFGGSDAPKSSPSSNPFSSSQTPKNTIEDVPGPSSSICISTASVNNAVATTSSSNDNLLMNIEMTIKGISPRNDES